MNRKKRLEIRKNTTLLSIIIEFISGLMMFCASLIIGNTLLTSLGWIVVFVLFSLIVGFATWKYETEKLCL